jgi:L-ascorbate metabolism protein UlaG (beta-lactamase superfamily)
MVLISHNHRDHLDKPSVLALEAQGSPHYVVPLGVDRYLRAWGVPQARVTTLDWWQSCAPLGDAPELRVSLVPAQHWSQRTPFDRNTSLWGGFVLQSPRRSVYFAGDSGYFEGFSMIGERFPGLDLALLPIGAYDPEWFMSPQHMNPEEAGRAMLELGAARMLSIHWGTYKLTDEPLDEPPARLEDWRAAQKIEPERILTLAAGGQVLL